MSEVPLPSPADAATETEVEQQPVCCEDCANPNRVDPLQWAAQKGHLDCVRHMVEVQEMSPNTTGHYRSTALMAASSKGRLQIVEYLIAKGASVAAKNANGSQPLHLSCGGGHVEVARVLLNNGADINARGDFKQTPVIYAISQMRGAVAQMLIENGADLTLKDVDGHGLLDFAETPEMIDIVKNYKNQLDSQYILK